MDLVIQPTVIPSKNYIAAMVMLNTVTASVVSVRLAVNWINNRKLLPDDYCSILGVGFTVGYSATSSMMNKSFNSNPDDIGIAFITSLASACIFTATAAMYFAKMPILIFVMRMFGIHKWLRYTGYFLMVITALCFLAASLWTGIHCSPYMHNPDPIFLFQCVGATYDSTVSRNSLSLVVDVVIFILPLPFVFKLHLSRRKKIGVALVFLMGSFGVGAAIASLYFQASQAAETSSNITNAMLTTIIECCTFLMVGCAPALRLFWSRHVGKTAFAARLGLGNSTAASGSKSAPSKQGASASKSYLVEDSNNSSMGRSHIRVTTDHYIELDDGPQAREPAYPDSAKVHENWC